MSQEAKLVIDWDGKTITIEGTENFVREEAERFRQRTAKPLGLLDEAKAPDPLSAAAIVAAKKPRGHSETVAVLAYFLASQGSETFNEDQMKRAYIQAHVRPPKVIAQAIRDARNKYDFIEPSKERGSYCLSVHGRRTVEFDLPRPIA